MELLRGKTLYALCKEIPLAPARAVRLIVQLLTALERAHALGIVHRDLKPGNLFVVGAGTDETLKVLDYGLARAVDAPSLTKTGDILGTPAYMAPEQARGQRVDERTDLFAAGACLYAALAGRPPIEGASPVQQVVPRDGGWGDAACEVAPGTPRSWRRWWSGPWRRSLPLDSVRRGRCARRSTGGWPPNGLRGHASVVWRWRWCWPRWRPGLLRGRTALEKRSGHRVTTSPWRGGGHRCHVRDRSGTAGTRVCVAGAAANRSAFGGCAGWLVHAVHPQRPVWRAREVLSRRLLVCERRAPLRQSLSHRRNRAPRLRLRHRVQRERDLRQ